MICFHVFWFISSVSLGTSEWVSWSRESRVGKVKAIHNTANFTTKDLAASRMQIHWGQKLLKAITSLLRDPFHLLFYICDSSPRVPIRRKNFSSILLKWPEFLSRSLRWKEGRHPIAPNQERFCSIKDTLNCVRSLLECPPTLRSPLLWGIRSEAGDAVKIKHRKSSHCYEVRFWHLNKCMNINKALTLLRLNQELKNWFFFFIHISRGTYCHKLKGIHTACQL